MMLKMVGCPPPRFLRGRETGVFLKNDRYFRNTPISRPQRNRGGGHPTIFSIMQNYVDCESFSQFRPHPRISIRSRIFHSSKNLKLFSRSAKTHVLDSRRFSFSALVRLWCGRVNTTGYRTASSLNKFRVSILYIVKFPANSQFPAASSVYHITARQAPPGP